MPDHHLVSDAAPAVPGPSFSSAPAVSGTNTRTYTIRLMVKVKKFKRDRVLSGSGSGSGNGKGKGKEKEEKLKSEFVYDVEKLSKDIGRKSVLELGTIIDIFDAKNMGDPKYGGDPVPILDFKTDRPLVDRLAKCANLAIDDYNSRMKTNYRFVDFEMAVWQPVNGVFYHITFRARNAEKEYQTFQATLFADRLMREVVKFRMKGSNTWHPGSLKEMI